YAERAAAIAPRVPNVAVTLVWALAGCGQSERARQVLSEMVSWYGPERPFGVWIAYAHASVGDIDGAFRWLGQAERTREYWLPWIIADPLSDPLRDDPRFAALLQRLGFEDRVTEQA